MNSSKIIPAIVLMLIVCLVAFAIATQHKKEIVTQAKAQDIVRALPEVERMLNMSSNWIITAEDRSDEHWHVQVAETVNDGSQGHTATLNWYKVSKENGEVVCSMFDYNGQGKLKVETNQNSCI